jgi:hypothetical protein
MFGTVGHPIRPRDRRKLEQAMNDEAYLTVNGYRWGQVLFDENDPGMR